MSRNNRKRKDFSRYSISEDGKSNVDFSLINEMIDETDETEQVALEHMLEAVEFVADNGAYMKAVEKGLIETESKPLYFLRCENYNVWKAADRIVAYWRERLVHFGEERAYRPMFDLSGNGALNAKDIEILKTAIFVELTQDNEGRTVLLLTAGKLSKEQLQCVDSRIRVFFFMISWVAPRDKMNQFSGVITMFLITGSLTFQVCRDCKAPDVRQVVVRLFQEAAPVKLHRVHPIFFTEQTSKNILDTIIINSLHIVNVLFSGYEKNLLIARKQEDIRQDFKRRGLKFEDFPKSIGGKYDYDTHINCMTDLEETSKAAAGGQSYLRVENLKKKLACSSYSPSESCLDGNQSMGSSHNGTSSYTSDKSDDGKYQNMNPTQKIQITDQSSDTESGSMMVVGNDQKLISFETIARRRHLLDEELQKLSGDEKMAFVLALQHVPSLVYDESNPLVFLIHKDDDPTAAVKLLCQYWNARLDLFGDRTFYRMQLTEGGALANEKIKAFKKGFIKVLPVDEKGRSILFYDSSLVEGISKEEINQCLFYALTVVMENPISWTKGIVFLFTAVNATLCQSLGVLSLSKLRNCFPIKFVTVHSVAEPGVHEIDLFSENVTYCLNELVQASGGELFIHEVQSIPSPLENTILPLPKKSLPDSLGGDLTDEKFLNWLSRRQALEKEVSQLEDSKALLDRQNLPNQVNNKMSLKCLEAKYSAWLKGNDNLQKFGEDVRGLFLCSFR